MKRLALMVLAIVAAFFYENQLVRWMSQTWHHISDYITRTMGR